MPWGVSSKLEGIRTQYVHKPEGGTSPYTWTCSSPPPYRHPWDTQVCKWRQILCAWKKNETHDKSHIHHTAPGGPRGTEQAPHEARFNQTAKNSCPKFGSRLLDDVQDLLRKLVVGFFCSNRFILKVDSCSFCAEIIHWDETPKIEFLTRSLEIMVTGLKIFRENIILNFEILWHSYSMSGIRAKVQNISIKKKVRYVPKTGTRRIIVRERNLWSCVCKSDGRLNPDPPEGLYRVSSTHLVA